MFELQSQWERLLQAAVGFLAFLLILMKGLNWLLLWMDDKDWILIPNQEAVKNADARLLNALLNVQAIAEPAKRQVLKKQDDDAVKREEDEEGGSPPER